MKLPALLVSDLHLTDKPADEYRWELFPWLRNQCAQHNVHTLFIGGDITDAKDYHSAQLTGRVVRSITSLSQHVKQIVILRGNHDFLRDGHTFFEFLNVWPGIQFITRPTESPDMSTNTLFLPYSKNPAAEWGDLTIGGYELVFMHQTFKGSRSSNGELMEGDLLPDLSCVGKVWSGDIHVPQVIGPVEYIGSPYPVHFGDAFRGRAVLLQADGKAQSLRMPTIRRLSLKVATLEDIQAQRLKAGDQVKVTLKLSAAEAHEWKTHRRLISEYIEGTGAELHELKMAVQQDRVRIDATHQVKQHKPEDSVLQYVEAESLGADALQIGLEVLES